MAAGQLDLKLFLEANDLFDASWARQLSRHDVSTLELAEVESEDKLLEYGIYDYDERLTALYYANIARELLAPLQYPTRSRIRMIRQNLLVSRASMHYMYVLQ